MYKNKLIADPMSVDNNFTLSSWLLRLDSVKDKHQIMIKEFKNTYEKSRIKLFGSLDEVRTKLIDIANNDATYFNAISSTPVEVRMEYSIFLGDYVVIDLPQEGIF